jgi:peptidoglycan/xylan/chitin deacetylase (PgdA/CDA1 family)
MFLTYHQIETQFSSHVYGVTVDALREHVAVFAARAADSRAPAGTGITFDDGHISNYEQALPVLQENGVRATFFIPASFVGKAADTVSPAQLRELSSLGHEVASHSWSHPVLTKCGSNELMDELVQSREALEDIIGREVRAISMPHGIWNSRVMAACKEAGYTRAYTSDFRRGEGTIAGLTVLGRLTVRRTMTATRIGEFLGARGIRLWSLAAPYVAKDAVKGMLGQDLYHKIWKQTLGRKRGQQAGPAAPATSKEMSGKL